MIDYQVLLKSARAGRDRAHAPYSGFKVGASALTDGGAMLAAGNVEMHGRRSFHAEENVCCRVAQSESEQSIKAIAVVASDEAAHVPCGRCLGMISEFSTPSSEIILPDGSGFIAKRVSEQLPEAYTGDRER